jgi:purine-nucleoside phosphorylase
VSRKGGAPAPDIGVAAAHLRRALPATPRVAVVLGSGLGHLADRLEHAVAIEFGSVPGLPPSTAPGHAGRFVFGSLEGSPVLLQAGRYHAYEGHPMEVVVAPVRILARLGVETLVLTNAAGGIRPTLVPGDLVLIEDHINFMFRSPLVGPVVESESRFPDMSAPYDPRLRDLALRVAAERGLPLSRGIYAGVLGPQFETAAEVRMLARLGADVVGMSTVPEVIVAGALGLRCVAFSMVTNHATGIGTEPISHEEVLEVGGRAGLRLGDLIAQLLAALEAQSTGTK